MANAPVPLSELPSVFLEPGQWQEFLDSRADHAAALDLLSLPDAGFMRLAIEAALNSATVGEKARRELHAHDMRDRLLADLRSRLGSGELTATGISSQGARMEIAPELWAGLHINFVANEAKSKAHRFTHVQVLSGSLPPSALLDACTAWLREQPLGPKKETLREAAILHLGKSVSQQVFNKAYKAVFQRKRGNPGKQSKLR